jgi:hypothetical protein
MTQKAKCPMSFHPSGILFWRRPTLARPIAVLPSGLQRFTAVFEMGTGGATVLLSPEIYPASAGQISGELKISNCRLQIVPRSATAATGARSTSNFQRTRFQIVNLQFEICNCRFSEIYIQEAKAQRFKASFYFEII